MQRSANATTVDRIVLPVCLAWSVAAGEVRKVRAVCGQKRKKVQSAGPPRSSKYPLFPRRRYRVCAESAAGAGSHLLSFHTPAEVSVPPRQGHRRWMASIEKSFACAVGQKIRRLPVFLWSRNGFWWEGGRVETGASVVDLLRFRVKALPPYQEMEYWGIGEGLIRGVPVFAISCRVERIPRPILTKALVYCCYIARAACQRLQGQANLCLASRQSGTCSYRAGVGPHIVCQGLCPLKRVFGCSKPRSSLFPVLLPYVRVSCSLCPMFDCCCCTCCVSRLRTTHPSNHCCEPPLSTPAHVLLGECCLANVGGNLGQYDLGLQQHHAYLYSLWSGAYSTL